MEPLLFCLSCIWVDESQHLSSAALPLKEILGLLGLAPIRKSDFHRFSRRSLWLIFHSERPERLCRGIRCEYTPPPRGQSRIMSDEQNHNDPGVNVSKQSAEAAAK